MMQQAKDEVSDLVAAAKFEEGAAKFQQVRAAYPNETEVCAASLHYEGMMWSRQAHEPQRALEPFCKLLDEYPQILSAETRVEMANNCCYVLGEYDKGLSALVEMVIHAPAYDGCGVYRGASFQVWADARLMEYLTLAASTLATQGRPDEFAHLARSPFGETCSTYVLHLVVKPMLENRQGLGVARTPDEDDRYKYLNTQFEKWLSWAPEEQLPPAPTQQLAWDLGDLNLVYGNSKHAAEVYSDLLNQMEAHPNDPRMSELIVRIARAAYSGFGLDDAVARLRAMAQAHPGTEAGATLCHAGDMLERAGRLDEAIAAWREGLESGTESPSGRETLTVISSTIRRRYLETRHSPDGLPAVEGLLQGMLQLALPASLKAKAQEYLAYTYTDEKRWDAAASLCQEMAVSYPGTMEGMEALLTIGRCEAHQAKYAEARESYQRLIREYPGTSWARQAQVESDLLPQQKP